MERFRIQRTQLRRFSLVFTLVLAMIVVGFVRYSSASSARVNVFGKRTASCGGYDAPAVFQGERIGLQLQGYQDSEITTIDITFPDGRVFSVDAAQLLDGVVDMPVNFPSQFRTDLGGDLYFDYPISGNFPYGCYTVTGHGVDSGKVASRSFAVIAGGGPSANNANVRLYVLDNTTGDPSGQQGTRVNIFGRGFVSNEVVSVWITAPNGAVIDFPQQVTSNAGNFESTFQFTEVNSTGTYQFTALGTASGYRQISTFNLTGRPSTQEGYGVLRVAYPASKQSIQRSVFEVQGERFRPYERVDIWMTLPDGSVRGLPSQAVDQFGSFYTDLYLDERLPTGEYKFTAKGADSGTLIITSLTLNQTGNVTPNFVDNPQVVDSNYGIDGGTTNTGDQQDSAGPETSPPDAGPINTNINPPGPADNW